MIGHVDKERFIRPHFACRPGQQGTLDRGRVAPHRIDIVGQAIVVGVLLRRGNVIDILIGKATALEDAIGAVGDVVNICLQAIGVITPGDDDHAALDIALPLDGNGRFALVALGVKDFDLDRVIANCHRQILDAEVVAGTAQAIIPEADIEALIGDLRTAQIGAAIARDPTKSQRIAGKGDIRAARWGLQR